LIDYLRQLKVGTQLKGSCRPCGLLSEIQSVYRCS